MSRYMLIMRSTPAAEEFVAENIDFTEIIAAMGRYNEELIKAGVLLAGEGGLTPPEEGFVVDFDADPPVVTDGPYTEAKELFNGFWILDVSSKEEAKQWARKCRWGAGREAGGPPGQRDRRVPAGQRVGAARDPVEGRYGRETGGRRPQGCGPLTGR